MQRNNEYLAKAKNKKKADKRTGSIEAAFIQGEAKRLNLAVAPTFAVVSAPHEASENKEAPTRKRERSKVRNKIGGVEGKFIQEQSQKLGLVEAPAPVVAEAPVDALKSEKKKPTRRGTGKAEQTLAQLELEKIIIANVRRESAEAKTEATYAPITACEKDDDANELPLHASFDDGVTPEVAASSATFFAKNNLMSDGNIKAAQLLKDFADVSATTSAQAAPVVKSSVKQPEALTTEMIDEFLQQSAASQTTAPKKDDSLFAWIDADLNAASHHLNQDPLFDLEMGLDAEHELLILPEKHDKKLEPTMLLPEHDSSFNSFESDAQLVIEDDQLSKQVALFEKDILDVNVKAPVVSAPLEEDNFFILRMLSTLKPEPTVEDEEVEVVTPTAVHKPSGLQTHSMLTRKRTTSLSADIVKALQDDEDVQLTTKRAQRMPGKNK